MVKRHALSRLEKITAAIRRNLEKSSRDQSQEAVEPTSGVKEQIFGTTDSVLEQGSNSQIRLLLDETLPRPLVDHIQNSGFFSRRVSYCDEINFYSRPLTPSAKGDILQFAWGRGLTLITTDPFYTKLENYRMHKPGVMRLPDVTNAVMLQAWEHFIQNMQHTPRFWDGRLVHFSGQSGKIKSCKPESALSLAEMRSGMAFYEIHGTYIDLEALSGAGAKSRVWISRDYPRRPTSRNAVPGQGAEVPEKF